MLSLLEMFMIHFIHKAYSAKLGKILSLFFILLIVFHWNQNLMAARALNSIPKHFTFEGPDALAIARVLGFDLHKNEEMSLGLTPSRLQIDPKTGKPSQPNSKPRVLIRYQANSKSPKITFAGIWQDAMTGTAIPSPQYVLRSPALNYERTQFPAWKKIFFQLMELPKATPENTQAKPWGYNLLLEWHLPNSSPTWLVFRVYQNDFLYHEKGVETVSEEFYIEIAIDDKPLHVRERRMKIYKNWLEKTKKNPIQGGAPPYTE